MSKYSNGYRKSQPAKHVAIVKKDGYDVCSYNHCSIHCNVNSSFVDYILNVKLGVTIVFQESSSDQKKKMIKIMKKLLTRI